MWLSWNNVDRHFAAIDGLRREMERGRSARLGRGRQVANWTEASVYDDGEAFVFTVDVPGVAPDDIQLDVHESTLTLSAKRQSAVPEGYAVQRQERADFAWNQSFALPAKVDAERTAARLEDGVLTVRLDKIPEAKPRRIALS